MGAIVDAANGIGTVFKPSRHTSGGSTVTPGTDGGPARTATPEEQAAGLEAQRRAWEQQQWQQQEDQRINDAAWEERKGFLTSMMPPQAIPQVPQGGWGYQPGKGATWMAPSQPSPAPPGAGGPPPPQQSTWSATPGNSPFKGNRI